MLSISGERARLLSSASLASVFGEAREPGRSADRDVAVDLRVGEGSQLDRGVELQALLERLVVGAPRRDGDRDEAVLGPEPVERLDAIGDQRGHDLVEPVEEEPEPIRLDPGSADQRSGIR